MTGAADPPVLSVCIPAYDRPALLATALESVLAQAAPLGASVQVVVSDDSTDDGPAAACRRAVRAWGVPVEHHRNRPALGMAANWNRCVELARGRYVLVLHDDDFLRPGALATVVAALDHGRRPAPVLLFGVDVVDAGGRRRRCQRVRHRHHLAPGQAVVELLADSSFVRFPGMVVSRAAYRAVAPFDEAVGEVADVLMWARLLAAHGLQREPAVTAAYRVHDGALTTGMWRPEVVHAAARVFDDPAVTALLGEAQRRRLQARWMSQFVLAGAWRRLRAGDGAGALEVLGLVDGPAAGGGAVPVSRRAGRRLLAAMAGAQRWRGGSSEPRHVPSVVAAVLLERPAQRRGREACSLQESPGPGRDGDTIPSGKGDEHADHADEDACQPAHRGA
jgi:hypothetical protein